MSDTEPSVSPPARSSPAGLVIGVISSGFGVWLMASGDVHPGAWLVVLGLLVGAGWWFVAMNARWVQAGRPRSEMAVVIRRVGLALLLAGVGAFGTTALFDDVANRTVAILLAAFLLLVGTRFLSTARRIADADERSP